MDKDQTADDAGEHADGSGGHGEVCRIRPAQFSKGRAHRGRCAVSAEKACGDEQAETIVDLGINSGDDEDREDDGQAKLQSLRQQTVADIGTGTLALTLEALGTEFDALETDRHEDKHNQRGSIAADIRRERDDIQPVRPKGHADDAGNQTGGKEQLLKHRDFGTQKLSDQNKRTCNGKVLHEGIH